MKTPRLAYWDARRGVGLDPRDSSLALSRRTSGGSVSIRSTQRRGRDSNPRYVLPYTAFPVPHLRPLGHLSGCNSKAGRALGVLSGNKGRDRDARYPSDRDRECRCSLRPPGSACNASFSGRTRSRPDLHHAKEHAWGMDGSACVNKSNKLQPVDSKRISRPDSAASSWRDECGSAWFLMFARPGRTTLRCAAIVAVRQSSQVALPETRRSVRCRLRLRDRACDSESPSSRPRPTPEIVPCPPIPRAPPAPAWPRRRGTRE